ncbi:gliding motility-associated C-terminal domain-containing protein [Dyadobacter luteus]|uniref:Gliding motility-associated C-terminal domain-containing protein n=1 Tax=Dyadobacter luteus TaxID=2259619 RepID=A0A3D8YGA0_9BACT|nr:gliding motility-associated C-terminal domain-containing protein [Dyadobacter luteus]REA63728.1 gliding motility-associated C-terminal domain-containing protein [Dyadobacter luteus]
MKRALWLLLFCNLLLSLSGKSQNVEHVYRFYENLTVSAPECGPDLIPLQNAGSCNAGQVHGTYQDDNPPCRANRKVYHNNPGWGLSYTNPQGVIGNSYTISMYVKVASWGGNKIPVLSFFNGADDDGIYFVKAPVGNEYCLSVSSQATVGECPFFNTNNYYLLTFTRNEQTGILSIYVNNALFATFNDAAGRYTANAGRAIHLFRNENVSSCDYAEVNFSYISFSNTASSQQKVAENYGNICYTANINSAVDFLITPNPSCGFPENITINYSGSIPANSTAYSFEWDWDGGKVISGSGRGPYQIAWDTPGPKDVSLVITHTECGETIQNTKIAEISALDLTTEVIQPSCADPLATVTVTPIEGKGPFQFSVDSVNFQSSEQFRIPADTYRIFVKDAGDCVVGKDLIIDPTGSVLVKTIEDTTICEGQTISLTTESNSEIHSWLPETGLDNAATKDPVASPNVTTTYIVSAGSDGCLQRDTVTITVIPKIEITVTPDTEIEEEIPFQLQAASTQLDNIAGSSYQWFPPTGLNNPRIANPVATLLSSNTYTVRGTTPEGCYAEASVTLLIIPPDWIYLPTAFSPNSDGKNDILYLNTKGIKEFSYLRIYNRWGQLVFYTNDITAGWDGRFRGAEPVAGVYTFQLSGVSDRNRTIRKEGSILLLR